MGSLSGRVVDATTNDAIPGAKIIVGCMTVKNPGATCTELEAAGSADGTFRADGLPAGNYLLIGNVDKYLDPHPVPTVTVEAGREHSNIVIALLKAAVIRGKVLDTDGKPLPGMEVEALSPRSDHRLHVISSAKADVTGAYTLDRLKAGKYFLAAQKGSVHFFFPSAVHAEDAQAVQIDFGQEYSDANIRVRSVPLLSISGRVADIEALPDKQNLTVRLYSHGAAVANVPAPQSPLTPDGRFHFDAMVQGDYALVLEQKRAINAGGVSSAFRLHVLAREDITLGRTDLTGIALVIPPKMNVTGNVVLENPNAGELPRAEIMLRPQDIFSFGDYKNVNPGDDGSFSLTNCEPARYSFQVIPPPGTYVEEVEYNRQPVVTRLLDFSNGAAGGLVIRLKRGTATLAGTIPADARDSYVYLIPDGWKPDDWRQMKRVLTEKHSFLFADIAPGRYTLVAANQELENPSELAGRGQAVDRNSGDQKQIELSITPAESSEP